MRRLAAAACLVATVALTIGGCQAGTTSPASGSPPTANNEPWAPCQRVSEIGYVSVIQVGPLLRHFVDRASQTSDRALAQGLFLAVCRTVDLQVRLPSGPISCPEATGSEVIARFSSDYQGQTLLKMLFFDSGCETMTMETATGEIRESAVFGTAAGQAVSSVTDYLQTILK
jgi:hypothetical protein